jgi:two-component system sensor histidine kinase ChvG
MASATDTATAEPADAPADFPALRDPGRNTIAPGAGAAPETASRWLRRRRHGRRRPVSPLTLRILAVNVLALALLGGGFLYLG